MYQIEQLGKVEIYQSKIHLSGFLSRYPDLWMKSSCQVWIGTGHKCMKYDRCLGFFGSGDTIHFRNVTFSMGADILTFNTIFTPEAASVTVSEIYCMIKTKLDCLVVCNARWATAGEQFEARGDLLVCDHHCSSHGRTLQDKLVLSPIPPLKLNLNLNLKMLYSTQHVKTIYRHSNHFKQEIVFIEI